MLAHYCTVKLHEHPRVDLALGKIEKMSFFMFLYFRLKNSNPSRQELSARKFKKLKNDIFSILPKARSTLICNVMLMVVQYA